MNEQEFREIIWEKGRELYRDMPWRRDTRPYYILVSELMLQQTQVDRVIPKFEAFIAAYPDERTLARESLAEVLKLWSGLGYNRRARFLHESAKKIVTEYEGHFPTDKADLLSLPGVGVNTAGAILAYAFNEPVVFIETNVRTVYFHHFFEDQEGVSDRELATLVEGTIDPEHPRKFYWALMDYGAWLKRSSASYLTKSKHYKKQSPLSGSVREVRGQIIRHLAVKEVPESTLRKVLAADDRFEAALAGLIADGLVTQTKSILHLTK